MMRGKKGADVILIAFIIIFLVLLIGLIFTFFYVRTSKSTSKTSESPDSVQITPPEGASSQEYNEETITNPNELSEEESAPGSDQLPEEQPNTTQQTDVTDPTQLPDENPPGM